MQNNRLIKRGKWHTRPLTQCQLGISRLAITDNEFVRMSGQENKGCAKHTQKKTLIQNIKAEYVQSFWGNDATRSLC